MSYEGMPLFQGIAARDLAIERAEAGADPSWFASACAAAIGIARKQDTLTTDDVWAALREIPVETQEPRAMGAVMKKLKKDMVLTNTYSHRLSSRPACHARPVTIWRSLIVEVAASDQISKESNEQHGHSQRRIGGARQQG